MFCPTQCTIADCRASTKFHCSLLSQCRQHIRQSRTDCRVRFFADELIAARDNVRMVSAELESTFTELISGI